MMLELKDKVFERLDALGLEGVRIRLDRGEPLGNPSLVREWLALQARRLAWSSTQSPAQIPAQTPVASDINARQRW